MRGRRRPRRQRLGRVCAAVPRGRAAGHAVPGHVRRALPGALHAAVARQAHRARAAPRVARPRHTAEATQANARYLVLPMIVWKIICH